MSRGFELLPPEQRAEAGYETAPGTVRQRPRRVLLPVMLFLATCYTTYIVGGIVFAAGVMTVLLTHELGHFIQAVRYRVPASLPYFIPMPYSPIGTMGAVIAMQPGVGDRRSIFDIGITGPLAGLVPALVFSIVGLQLSDVVLVNGPVEGVPRIGAPLLFKALSYLIFGPGPANRLIDLHPLAFAGWVGVFITALNLVPIGQLDGGHVLYCLLLKLRARCGPVAVVRRDGGHGVFWLLAVDHHDFPVDADGADPSADGERRHSAGYRADDLRLGELAVCAARVYAGAVYVRRAAPT